MGGLKIGKPCPKCETGIIFADWRARVCICCGLREDDNITAQDRKNDLLLWWLIRNKPSETYSDPLQRKIYIGKTSVGSLSVKV